MDWQAAELLEAVERSLQSQEVEFGVNMMVCDMVLANPDLTILVLPRLRVALSTSASTTSSSSSSSSSTAAGAASQRRTQKGPPDPFLAPAARSLQSMMNVGKAAQIRKTGVALSLLEMLIKNCGMAFVRYLDKPFLATWESLIKKKQSVGYKVARNLNHLFSGGASLFAGTSSTGSSASSSRRSAAAAANAERAVGAPVLTTTSAAATPATSSRSSGTSRNGVDNELSQQWDEVVSKALSLLQLIGTTLMLHEHENPAVFALYRRLRSTTALRFPKPKPTDGVGVRDALAEEEMAAAAAWSWKTTKLYGRRELLQTELGAGQEFTDLEACARELSREADETCVASAEADAKASAASGREELKSVDLLDGVDLDCPQQQAPPVTEGEVAPPRMQPDTDLAAFLRQVRPRLCLSIQSQAEKGEAGEDALLVSMNLLSRIDDLLDNSFVPRPPAPTSETNSGHAAVISCGNCGNRLPVQSRVCDFCGAIQGRRPLQRMQRASSSAGRGGSVLISDERKLEGIGSSTTGNGVTHGGAGTGGGVDVPATSSSNIRFNPAARRASKKNTWLAGGKELLFAKSSGRGGGQQSTALLGKSESSACSSGPASRGKSKGSPSRKSLLLHQGGGWGTDEVDGMVGRDEVESSEDEEGENSIMRHDPDWRYIDARKNADGTTNAGYWFNRKTATAHWYKGGRGRAAAEDEEADEIEDGGDDSRMLNAINEVEDAGSFAFQFEEMHDDRWIVNKDVVKELTSTTTHTQQELLQLQVDDDRNCGQETK